MPGLLIKGLPEETHELLKRRAARHHRSLTKEAIAILETVLSTERDRPSLAVVDRRRVRGSRPLKASVVRRGKSAGRP